MNRPAVCLRCDWEGQTRGATCPNCGVHLYHHTESVNRTAPRFARLRAARSRKPTPTETSPPLVARGPLSTRERQPRKEITEEVAGSDRRSGAGAIVVASAVLVAGVAVWFVQRHTASPVHRATGEVGSIVYAARAPDGQTRLYRWDLLADVVHRGPVVHDLIGLFDASAAHPGWVGETSASPSGGVDIGVFKFLGPDDQALPLGHGDIAAWAPFGADAVVVTARPDGNGCSKLYSLSIHLAPLQKDPTAGERVCAALDGVQLNKRVTYLSLRGARGSRVATLSVGRLRPVLSQYHLDSLSPSNDMLVTPDVPSAHPSPPPSGAALYFRGPASQSPTPYASGDTPFVLDRVLAWAPDGTEALALGSAASGPGFYRLVAAPPLGPTQPVTYVGPSTGFSEAVYTGVGTRLVFSGGRFSRVFDGSTTPFPMPTGAPVPTGPMVWVGA